MSAASSAATSALAKAERSCVLISSMVSNCAAPQENFSVNRDVATSLAFLAARRFALLDIPVGSCASSCATMSVAGACVSTSILPATGLEVLPATELMCASCVSSALDVSDASDHNCGAHAPALLGGSSYGLFLLGPPPPCSSSRASSAPPWGPSERCEGSNT